MTAALISGKSLSKWLYYECGVYIKPAGLPAGFSYASSSDPSEFLWAAGGSIGRFLFRPGQLALGVEADWVAGVGFEVGGGIVLDRSSLWKWGGYFTGGPAFGENFGIGGGAAYFPDGEVRGNSVQVDVNGKGRRAVQKLMEIIS